MAVLIIDGLSPIQEIESVYSTVDEVEVMGISETAIVFNQLKERNEDFDFYDEHKKDDIPLSIENRKQLFILNKEEAKHLVSFIKTYFDL